MLHAMLTFPKTNVLFPKTSLYSVYVDRKLLQKMLILLLEGAKVFWLNVFHPPSCLSKCRLTWAFNSDTMTPKLTQNFSFLRVVVKHPRTSSVSSAPSYTLHAPAIIRVVGCAAPCDSIVCGHLSTSKVIKVQPNIVAQNLLAKYYVTLMSKNFKLTKRWRDLP